MMLDQEELCALIRQLCCDLDVDLDQLDACQGAEALLGSQIRTLHFAAEGGFIELAAVSRLARLRLTIGGSLSGRDVDVVGIQLNDLLCTGFRRDQTFDL